MTIRELFFWLTDQSAWWLLTLAVPYLFIAAVVALLDIP